MKVNKVYYGNQLLVDLTDATVSEKQLLKDVIAYGADGEKIIGTNNTMALSPIEYDYNIGYIEYDSLWKYQSPIDTYTDIYKVQSGHRYFISLGKNIGTRFRAMFCPLDVRDRTEDLSGQFIIYDNAPTPYQNVSQESPWDGYLLISKDHIGKTGLISYVYDTTNWI